MSVGSCAKLIAEQYGVSVKARDITRLLYDGELRFDLCPLESGRRVITPVAVPMIVAALQRRGKLRRAA
jgi:hypothetical protein